MGEDFAWPSGLKLTEGVVPMKELRGSLKKHHHRDHLLSGRGKRHVWVNDVDGCLCYAKNERDSKHKKVCALNEITNISMGHNMYDKAEIKCFILTHGRADDPKSMVFTADDREGACMWVNQIMLRIRRFPKS